MRSHAGMHEMWPATNTIQLLQVQSVFVALRQREGMLLTTSTIQTHCTADADDNDDDQMFAV